VFKFLEADAWSRSGFPLCGGILWNFAETGFFLGRLTSSYGKKSHNYRCKKNIAEVLHRRIFFYAHPKKSIS